jgi:hypothetical protein
MNQHVEWERAHSVYRFLPMHKPFSERVLFIQENSCAEDTTVIVIVIIAKYQRPDSFQRGRLNSNTPS